jgi:hypothetical protein
MKICRNCKEEKDLSEFHKSKCFKDGYRNICKKCRNIESIANREKRAEYNKQYYENNKDEILKQNKLYRDLNNDTIKMQRKKYRENNKEHIKKKNEEYKPIRREKIKERRKGDLSYRISEVYKSKLHRAIKKNGEVYSEWLGCNISFLLKWLEFQFDKAMSWDNYGTYWHIDHILPINCFNFVNKNERKICFNWKNLQPLEKNENRDKSDKIEIKYVIKLFDNIKKINLQYDLSKEYQELKETLVWLREKLRYGKNFRDEEITNKIISEIDNPQLNS